MDIHTRSIQKLWNRYDWKFWIDNLGPTSHLGFGCVRKKCIEQPSKNGKFAYRVMMINKNTFERWERGERKVGRDTIAWTLRAFIYHFGLYILHDARAETFMSRHNHGICMCVDKNLNIIPYDIDESIKSVSEREREYVKKVRGICDHCLASQKCIYIWIALILCFRAHTQTPNRIASWDG